MIYNFFQIYFISIITCILFLTFVINDKSFSINTKKDFFSIICIILLLTLVDNLDFIEKQDSVSHFVRRIYISTGYILRPLMVILMTKIVNRTIPGKTSSKRVVIYFSVFFINMIAAIISMFNECIYGLTPNNVFFRGPLGYLPFFTGFLYIFIMIVQTLQKFGKNRTVETMVIFILAFLSIVAILIESLFKFRGMITGFCTIGTILYYIYLHVNLYSIDQLTQAYNRRIFFLDAEKFKNKNVFIATMDMNGLKAINDTQGHSAGDKAIASFATIVHKTCPRCCSLYRMGGDEFTLLCTNLNQAQVEHILDTIEQQMNQQSYSFAYGIMPYPAGGNIDEVNNMADQKMYAMKKRMKI